MNRPSQRPRILIHIEDPRRDAPVLIALACLLERAGARVLLSTRRTTGWLLNALPFEAALVASPENIAYGAYPTLRRRTKIYLLPTEGAIFEEGPLLSKYAGGANPEKWDRHIQGICRFFLWGDNSRRILLGTGRFQEEQLLVIGAPRMDFFLAPAPTQETTGEQMTPVGVISSFPLINSIVPESLFKKIDLNRKVNWAFQSRARDFEDRLWAEAARFRILLSFFDECQRRGQRLWIRTHQQENRGNWRYFQNKYGQTLYFGEEGLPFEAWLDRIRLVAGFNSTTFFEIVASGKPAINLGGLVGPRLIEHTDRFPQSCYPIMEHLPTPHSWEELFALIGPVRRSGPAAAFEHSPQARAILQDVCHFPRPVCALARVVHTIFADLGETPRRDPASWWEEARGRAKAKALEIYSFRIRRDPVGNCWFPLQEKRLRRLYADEIQRYLRAGQAWPFQEKLLAEPSDLKEQKVMV